jgi:hypothetical protein
LQGFDETDNLRATGLHQFGKALVIGCDKIDKDQKESCRYSITKILFHGSTLLEKAEHKEASHNGSNQHCETRNALH